MRLLFSLLFSGVLVLLLFRLVGNQPPGQDGLTPASLFKTVFWPLASLYLAAQLGQAWLRAVRYRLLLQSGGVDVMPSAMVVFTVTLVRNMLVDLVPARLGELSYILMLNRGHKVSAAVCTSSLGLSIVFDLIALVVVVAVLLALSFNDLASGLIMPVLVGLLLSSVGFGLLYGAGPLARVLRRVDSGKSPAWWRRVSEFFLHVLDSVGEVWHSKKLGQVMLYSLGIRIFKYSGLYVLFLAVTWRSFPDLAGAPLWQVVAAFIGAEASSSLPVPAFMSFGTYEAGGLLALTLLSFTAAESMTALFMVHLLSQVADYLLGAAGGTAFALGLGHGTTRHG